MSDLGDRLREARGRESRESAGKKLGVHPNTLANYESGERVPDAQFLADACKTYGVSEAWILAGKGHMRAFTLTGPTPAFEEARPFDGPASSPVSVAGDDGDMVQIPKLELRAGAGGLQLVDDEPSVSSVALSRAQLKALDIEPRYAVMMDAAGDSMTPTIADGEPMLIDTAKRDLRDKIYVVRRGGAVFVKRLQRRSDGSLLLLSDNPAHAPEPLPSDEADELEILGLVRFVFKSV
jgi:phage repressor protein C with HTH and peptisase S24 domain